MSKAGSWLDKRLSKLIGVADVSEGQGDAAKPPTVPQHRRSTSQSDVPKVQKLPFDNMLGDIHLAPRGHLTHGCGKIESVKPCHSFSLFLSLRSEVSKCRAQIR